MKTKLRQFVPLLFCLLVGGTVSAQNALKFSLEEAKAYALKNSYVVRNSGIDVFSARKKVWETIATGLPQINGEANYSNFLNLPVSLIPGEFFGEEPGTYVPVKFGQDYSSDFGFTVNQKIFDGSYLVGIGSAKIYLQLSTQALEKTEIEIRYAVEQAYYMALIGIKTAYGNSANLFKNSVPWFKSSMWGVNISVPIFSAGERIAKVRQAEFAYEKSVNDQKLAVQSLQKDYLTAVADVESAIDQLKNDEDNKMLAKRILDKTVIKYNNGMVSSTELAQTESQYIQSQGAWVSSVMQLLTYKINLDKATGK